MRRSLICLLAGALSGCAAIPAEDPWQDLTVETEPAVRPNDCGKLPGPSEATETMVVYDVAAANRLERYRLCAEDNQGIAAENAAAIDELKIVRKSLTGAGAAEHRIAEMRREILEEERRHMLWERLEYWAIILALGAAAL